ncbi:DUF1559 domain-containing protein [Gimesia alba]|uniref:DUF1559 domain-containing protein n=1 Tax=Gimesia alba TaxID=2527973 RepID=UPI001E5C3FAB|nr:DUF1559 domain-containing protein [Gimesia alba]
MSTRRSLLTVAAMLSCLFALGIHEVPAQEKPSRVTKPKTATVKLKPFRMDFAPEDALGVLAVRPAQLLGEKAMSPVLQLTLREQQKNSDSNFLGVDPTKLETVTIIYLLSELGKVEQKPVDFVSVLQSTQNLDQALVQKKFSKTNLIESNYKGKTFLTNTSPDGDSLLFLDDKSFIISDKASALKKVIDSMQDQNNHTWEERLQPVETASIAGAINMQTARILLGGMVQSQSVKIPVWPLISPVWEHSEIAALGITLQQKLSLELAFTQEKNSPEIRQALQSLLGLGQNMLRQMNANNKQTKRPLRPDQEAQIKLVEQILGSTRVTQNEDLVKLSTSLNSETCTNMVAAILPGILQAREAARRSASKNNIRRIMLAFHNYHLDHKHFPPAVVVGPDGKTPHSWRVELLPYLDQQALYDQYRMNEPWDSPHNRKIAKTVVPVFNNPNSEKSTNASYFVVTGPGTVFGNKTGIKLSEILGGTSNTIAVFEAKRDIPWTKPADIPFDGKKVPEFGGFHQGGAHVGLCDGSVRFLSELTNKDFLKTLLTISADQKEPAP